MATNPWDSSSGIIAEAATAVGEQVAAGASVAQLAGLGVWQIENTDLTELNIVRSRRAMP